jgi:hypothetical protein
MQKLHQKLRLCVSVKISCSNIPAHSRSIANTPLSHLAPTLDPDGNCRINGTSYLSIKHAVISAPKGLQAK